VGCRFESCWDRQDLCPFYKGFLLVLASFFRDFRAVSHFTALRVFSRTYLNLQALVFRYLQHGNSTAVHCSFQ
jgi:hypothetical protein